MCNNFSNIKSVYKIIKDQSLIVEVYHGSFTVNEIIKFKLLVSIVNLNISNILRFILFIFTTAQKVIFGFKLTISNPVNYV
jgi:hypothetical protein